MKTKMRAKGIKALALVFYAVERVPVWHLKRTLFSDKLNCTRNNHYLCNYIPQTLTADRILKNGIWCSAEFFIASICTSNAISGIRKADTICNAALNKNWFDTTEDAFLKFRYRFKTIIFFCVKNIS